MAPTYARAMAISPGFEFADRFVTEQSALDPCLATFRGIPGYDHVLTDFSPDGHDARDAHTRQALSELHDLVDGDENDRRARCFINERFEVALLKHEIGEWKRTMDAVASPTTILRGTFDLMPRDGEAAWENIAARMHLLPEALSGLRATYDEGRATGHVATRRQALVAAEQCATWAANRWFDSLQSEAEHHDLPDALQRRVRDGADLATTPRCHHRRVGDRVVLPCRRSQRRDAARHGTDSRRVIAPADRFGHTSRSTTAVIPGRDSTAGVRSIQPAGA